MTVRIGYRGIIIRSGCNLAGLLINRSCFDGFRACLVRVEAERCAFQSACGNALCVVVACFLNLVQLVGFIFAAALTVDQAVYREGVVVGIDLLHVFLPACLFRRIVTEMKLRVV